MGDLQRDKERAGCVAKRLKDHLIVVLKQGRNQNFKLGGGGLLVAICSGFNL